jgi:hypothetical protein
MRTRRSARPRLRVEELEPRVVLSTLPGYPAYITPSPISHASLATTSTNWAGYAVQSNLNTPANGVVTAVSGSWTVPAVTGSAGATAYSAVWIGIDGYSSSTVEQIGTESDWSDGAPVYYVWYEMYPRDSVTVTKLTVKPDDSVSASVTFAAGKFTLAITDTTEKQSFSTVQTLAGAQRSSAEWIVEAPSSNFGVLPLANFGSTTITNASATFTKAGKSTTGPIDGPGWQSASMNMVTQGNATLASTGAVADSAGKSSFAVGYTAPATSTPAPSQHHHWWFSTNAGSVALMMIGQNDGLMGTSLVNVANTNVAIAPSAARVLPVGMSTAPSVAQTPSFMNFRAFGLGEDAAVEDADGPMPRMPAPMPDREAPPAVVPPGDTTAFVGPTAAPAGAPAPMTPETPSERRELRAGDVGETLLALFGVAGVVALGGEAGAVKCESRKNERTKTRSRNDM